MRYQKITLSKTIIKASNHSKYLSKKGISILFFLVLLFNAYAQIQIQFEEVLPVNAPFDQISSSFIAFADIDSDNDQDVLITGVYYDGALQIISKLYSNDGLGNYTLVTGTPFIGVYNGSSVAFADIDGDNDLDVLITGDKGSFVGSSELYVNDGFGNYTLVADTPFDAVRNSAIAFADIDGDNDQDVLIMGYNGSARISKLYSNDGTGIFSLVSDTPFLGVNSGTVAFADVDNDNDQDVLIIGINGSGGTSNLYINDGTGNYSLNPAPPFDTSQSGDCAFADIDGDNDQDVLMTGYNGSSEFSKLYINDGTGIFSLASDTPFTGVYHSSIAFADIDGDNDQDVLISGWNGVVISSNLYTNDGIGVYTLESTVNFENVYEGSLAFADIDGDNDQDLLITGNDGAGAISKLYRNNTCSATTGIDVITACDSLTWIDGLTYSASNDTATYTLTNMAGCDSVVTLDLTINYSNTGVDIITACDSYTWIDGITYTEANNTATYTLSNMAECDSVVTLDLTINMVDVTVTITDPTITSNATGASYQWLDCSAAYTIIPGETAQSFTAIVNGDYAVEVTENSCTDTSACVSISTVGMAETSMFNSISIYPNPIQEMVNINLGTLTEVSIKIFNVSGKLVYSQDNINTPICNFEFKEAPGIYFIELSSVEKKQRYKLIKK